jgi:hypothetical protein
MDWILVHAGHLVPLIGLGGWLGWARLARSRAARRPAARWTCRWTGACC